MNVEVTTRDDPDLIARAKAGDKDAFAELTMPHYDRLVHLAKRYIWNHETALDVAQHALERGLKKIGSFKGEAGIFTWLGQIAINYAIDLIRINRRRHAILETRA